ncbi:MAG: hypothetical protein J07HN6_02520 [Halonotius sp. J07HN6]|nr:MAG: hypothetical protein J07HN6_02520 [Halonotius sp. J07HN6]
MDTLTIRVATCDIESSMTHGALTLPETDGSKTFHVVEYASAEIRQTLSDLEEGTSVRVGLTRVGSRGDTWKIVEIRDETPNASTGEEFLTLDS